MLLNEFNRPDSNLEHKKSARLLESAYGVKIKETNDLHELFTAASKANAIMENLRLQNRTIEDKEFSKYALIKEAITAKIDAIYEQRLMEFEGVPSVNTGSAKFRRILDATVARAIEQYDSGMDLEDVTRNAIYAFRNTPGIVVPSEIFKIEFEKAFLQKLYFSGREPEMSQGPSHYDTAKPASTLLDSLNEEELAEALNQMDAIVEGALMESDVDLDRLTQIAEEILESRSRFISDKERRDASQRADKFIGSLKNTKISGEEPDPVKVDFSGKTHDPRDPKLKALKLRLAKQAQEEGK